MAMNITEDVTGVVNNVVKTLPAQFLMMLLVNVVFILGLLWFMHDIQITRIEAITKIFETCASAISRNQSPSSGLNFGHLADNTVRGGGDF